MLFKSTDVKSGEKELWGMVFYRWSALPFVNLCVRSKIPPNMITTMTFAAALLTFIFLLSRQFIAAAICWQLVAILDVSDGMVARRINQSSDFGMWYDYFVDRINYFLFLLGIGLVVGGGNGLWFIFVALTLSYLTDISCLIGRLQAKRGSYQQDAQKVQKDAGQPSKNSLMGGILKNVVLVHVHLWAFFGIPLFWGESGLPVIMVYITGILFLNVLYHIREHFLAK